MTNNNNSDQIRGLLKHDFTKLYHLFDDDNETIDSPLHAANLGCKYYEPTGFRETFDNAIHEQSYFHINCRGISVNWNDFKDLIFDLTGEDASFEFIGLSEVYKCESDTRLLLPGYHPLITRTRNLDNRGGVGLFIRSNIKFTIREDLSVFIPHIFESIFIEYISIKKKRCVVGVIYRPNTPPKADIDVFMHTLNDIVDLINTENKQCLIMGDMNVDLLKYQNHAKTNQYTDSLFSNGLVPLITIPTRVSRSSATLIDHMYSNRIATNATSGVIITDLADHYGTFYLADKQTHDGKPKLSGINKRLFTDKNMETFKNLLQDTDFEYVFSSHCPSEAYSIFLRYFNNALEEAFPMKTVPRNRRSFKRDPWMTRGMLISSRNKITLYKKSKQNKCESYQVKYKMYNNIFNKLRRKLKRQYFNDALLKYRHDVKSTWDLLREAMGTKKTKVCFPDEICTNSDIITDKKQIAEEFNNFFINISSNIHSRLPNHNSTPISFSQPQGIHTFFLDPIDPQDIIEVSKIIKPKLSAGFDNISSKLMKDTIDLTAIPLAHIINLSFETGIFPDDMKTAKVIPIFKSANPNQVSNYRPISLLPAYSKLMEKIVYKKLHSFLEYHKLLYKHQYGFRSKHSTVHPIIHFLNFCSEAHDHSPSEITLSIFCDLSKAFDVIDHTILYEKLYRLGIRGSMLQWIRSYLTDRKQFVDIDGVKSSCKTVVHGVPQGSILGPLLFLLYVNDIQFASTATVLSFADDTTLLVSSSNPADLIEKANLAMSQMHNYFTANKLLLNISKTKFMIIKPKQKSFDLSDISIILNGEKLQRVGNGNKEEAIKFLGIFIDENLTWKQHISHVKMKVSRTLFAINKVKNVLPSSSLEMLYYSLIHSHLTYGNLAWGNAAPNILKSLFLLQKKALRYIYKAKYNSHTEPLFKNAQILMLKDLYQSQVALFMHDYENNLLPSSFINTFSHNGDININCRTRFSHRIYLPRYTSRFSYDLPPHVFPRIWNNINDLFTAVDGRGEFKRKIKMDLLNGYKREVRCNNPQCKDCIT